MHTATVCLECGLEFIPAPRAVVCSDECRRLRKRALKLARRGKPKRARATQCSECGEPFGANPQCRETCGPECRKARDRRLVSRIQVCPECREEFTTSSSKQTYCSHRCAGLGNQNRRLHHPACPQCGVDVLRYGARFCSKTCRKLFKTEETVGPWLRGEISGSGTNGKLRGTLRLFLLEEAGWKCTECGWGTVNPAVGHPILSIDHIDGDWRNNARANLVVLCFNCHTLTPTFGALNRGNPAAADRVRPERSLAAAVGAGKS